MMSSFHHQQQSMYSSSCSMSSTMFDSDSSFPVIEESKLKRKSVRFHETAKVILVENRRGDFSTWLGKDDYSAFKADVLREARKIARSSSPAACNFRRTTTAAFHSCIHYSMVRNNKDLFTSSAQSIMCEADQRDLAKAYKDVGTAPGLERVGVRALFDDKKSRRKQLLNKLGEIQDKQDHPLFRKSSAALLELRYELQTISRPSCLFSQKVARALSASLL